MLVMAIYEHSAQVLVAASSESRGFDARIAILAKSARSTRSSLVVSPIWSTCSATSPSIKHPRGPIFHVGQYILRESPCRSIQEKKALPMGGGRLFLSQVLEYITIIA